MSKTIKKGEGWITGILSCDNIRLCFIFPHTYVGSIGWY